MKLFRPKLFLRIACALALVSAAVASYIAHSLDHRPTKSELVHWRSAFGGPGCMTFPHREVKIESMYVTMRDGVRIAMELYLPADLKPEETVPAIIMPTRYWRRFDLIEPVRSLLPASGRHRRFVGAGYAVAEIDARGTGASFGSRKHPFSHDERLDYAEIISFLAAQPWCSGRVGAMGISYVGTAAEMAVVPGAEALQAVVPKYSFYDAYADIAFPGGVYNTWMMKHWGEYNVAIDGGALPSDLPWYFRMLVKGVKPVVADDASPAERAEAEGVLAEAIREHIWSINTFESTKTLHDNDERSCLAEITFREISPYGYRDEIDAANIPFFAWSGWSDGAYADSLLKRFSTMKRSGRAVVGPWNHAGVEDTSPYRPAEADARPAKVVHHLEQLRFFDYWLKDKGERPKDELLYYVIGRECWKTTTQWPPEGAAKHVLYAAQDGRLTLDAPQESVSEPKPLSLTTSTAPLNRWRTQLFRNDIVYSDDLLNHPEMIVFQSEPLVRDLEIAGNAVLWLQAAVNDVDGAMHAYLVDVHANGTAYGLTEGMLRGRHRAVSQEEPPYALSEPYLSFNSADAQDLVPGEFHRWPIKFLAVSALIRKGHSIRVVISGADKDQFKTYWTKDDPTMRVMFGGHDPSRLELPTAPADAATCLHTYEM